MPTTAEPSPTSGFPPALRLACVLWLAVGIAVNVRTILQPGNHTVFPVFAGGARHWWHDQPLYGDYKPIDYFRNPPFFAVLFTPFAAAGLRAGGILWTWVGLAIYASGLWRFRQVVLLQGWSTGREAAFWTLATLGALAGLWNGQSNALLVGMLLWGASALIDGRDWISAIWLALAVSCKLTPSPLALLLCALWPRRLAGRFIGALAAAALVPFLTRPWGMVLQHYADFFAQQGILASERWPGFRDAWTVWQVVRHTYAGNHGLIPLKDPLVSPAYRALQLATALGCLIWCLWQRARSVDSRSLVLRTLGMGSVWVLLFGTAVEHPTYVFLAPFLAAAVADPAGPPISRTLSMLASGLILTCGWGALALPLAPAFPVILAALPAGTALFALGLVLAAAPARLRPTLLAENGAAESRAVTSAAA